MGRENKVQTGAGMYSTLRFLGGRIDPGSAWGRGRIDQKWMTNREMLSFQAISGNNYAVLPPGSLFKDQGL